MVIQREPLHTVRHALCYADAEPRYTLAMEVEAVVDRLRIQQSFGLPKYILHLEWVGDCRRSWPVSTLVHSSHGELWLSIFHNGQDIHKESHKPSSLHIRRTP